MLRVNRPRTFLMSPTAFNSYPGANAAPGKESTQTASVDPMVDALRDCTAPVLCGFLADMLDDVAKALAQVDPRATIGEMSYPHEAIVERIGQKRAELEDEFAELLAASYEAETDQGNEIDLDRLSIEPTEELEERLALGSLIDRIEAVHAGALEDLRGRVTHMIRQMGVPISRQVLSPEVIVNAYSQSLAHLGLPLAARVLMFKLFDQCGMPTLADIFDAAIQLLEDQGVDPTSVEPETEIDGEEEIAQEPIFSAPSLDSATQAALRRISAAQHDTMAGDAAFAQELLGFATTDEATHEHIATAQRLSLIGQMCNEIISDPHLPASMHPLFDRLRFPLIKVALADGTFFSQPGHPVRRLVIEAAETASASHIASKAVIRRLEERLTQISEQANLSAAFVRPQLSKLKPLTMAQIATFLDQQREESRSRRENVISKVRRAVAQEMDVHSLGLKKSTSMTNFLRMGWGPLMSSRLLRAGMNSAEWLAGIDRLDELVASVDVRKITEEQIERRPELRRTVEQELQKAGMRPQRISEALEYLDAAHAELDEQRKAMTPQQRLDGASDDLELLSPAETARMMGGGQGEAAQLARAPAGTLDLPEADMFKVLEDEARKASPLADDDELTFDVQPEEAATEAAPFERPAEALELEPEPVQEQSGASEKRSAESVTAAASTKSLDPPPADEDGLASPTMLPGNRDAAPGKSGPHDDMATATELELLAYCLTAETWFRVFDPKSQHTLWLKVSSYYPEHGSIGFSGFDSKTMLSLRTTQLLDDLVDSRSEPVNPTPIQARAIAELRKRKK